MRLSTREIEQLGDSYGFGTAASDGEFIWFDSNPTELIRAAINLEREKLLADLEKQRERKHSRDADVWRDATDNAIDIVKEYP